MNILQLNDILVWWLQEEVSFGVERDRMQKRLGMKVRRVTTKALNKKTVTEAPMGNSGNGLVKYLPASKSFCVSQNWPAVDRERDGQVV
jgi:hypothetical protein